MKATPAKNRDLEMARKLTLEMQIVPGWRWEETQEDCVAQILTITGRKKAKSTMYNYGPWKTKCVSHKIDMRVLQPDMGQKMGMRSTGGKRPKM